MIHTVVEKWHLVLWFGFLVRSQQLLDCFLTKKTLTTKDIKESHPCFVSQTSASLQPAKPCQVERGQLKKRGWARKQLHRIRRLRTNFLTLFFSLSRLKQAVVDHPFYCPVKNKRILFHASVCSIQGWLNHSSPHELPPVSGTARGDEVTMLPHVSL